MKNNRVIWLIKERDSSGDYTNEIKLWYGVLESLGYDVVYSPYESYNPDEFYDSAKAFDPSFIITCSYNTLHTELIKVKQFTKLAVFHFDISAQYDFARYWIPFVDATFTLSENYVIPINDRPDNHIHIEFQNYYNPHINKQANIQNETCLHEWNKKLSKFDKSYIQKTDIEIDKIVTKIFENK